MEKTLFFKIVRSPVFVGAILGTTYVASKLSFTEDRDEVALSYNTGARTSYKINFVIPNSDLPTIWYPYAMNTIGDYFDPEDMHHAAIRALSQHVMVRGALGLIDNRSDPLNLRAEVLGLEFRSPVGIAAGFDKNGEALRGIAGLGPGFVEVGSVTPLPQSGNDRPRLFRLSEDQSIINRMGFNNQGMERVYAHLIEFRKIVEWQLTRGRAKELQWRNEKKAKLRDKLMQERVNQRYTSGGADPGMSNEAIEDAVEYAVRTSNSVHDIPMIVGVNLGKNKTTEDPVKDYTSLIHRLGGLADYLVINISSPNTPGLRDLQRKEHLTTLLSSCLEARDSLARRVPLLVKVAPDLTVSERAEIAQVCLSLGVDGLIVSNTTISRPESLQSPYRTQTGGLSGHALRNLSTETVADMYVLTGGMLPIIGVGGVSSAEDAMDKITAGASLVQMYSGLVYKGPQLIRDVKMGLSDMLEAKGATNVSQLVGENALTVSPWAKSRGEAEVLKYLSETRQRHVEDRRKKGWGLIEPRQVYKLGNEVSLVEGLKKGLDSNQGT